MPRKSTAPLAFAQPVIDPKAPVSLTAKDVLLPKPLTYGIFAFGTVSVLLSVLRPKALPKQAQLAADGLSLTIVGVHPIEGLALARYLRRYNITTSSRRKAQLATSVFGLFAAIPSLRSARKAGQA